MKYPIVDRVGTIQADQQTVYRCYGASLKIRSRRVDPKRVGTGLRGNVHLLKLDPRQTEEIEHPQLIDDLREIQIGLRLIETTKTGVGLGHKVEEQLIDFLRKNRDVFAWAPKEMLGTDPDFLYHQLSIIPGARPIT
ncbi:hypothetical protein CR513_32897, partial [Mucuna pruriens]